MVRRCRGRDRHTPLFFCSLLNGAVYSSGLTWIRPNLYEINTFFETRVNTRQFSKKPEGRLSKIRTPSGAKKYEIIQFFRWVVVLIRLLNPYVSG